MAHAMHFHNLPEGCKYYKPREENMSGHHLLMTTLAVATVSRMGVNLAAYFGGFTVSSDTLIGCSVGTGIVGFSLIASAFSRFVRGSTPLDWLDRLEIDVERVTDASEDINRLLEAQERSKAPNRSLLVVVPEGNWLVIKTPGDENTLNWMRFLPVDDDFDFTTINTDQAMFVEHNGVLKYATKEGFQPLLKETVDHLKVDMCFGFTTSIQFNRSF